MMPLKRADLHLKLPPLDWAVDDLILRGYINTIASLPGEGKTALLTGLAWQASRPDGMFLGRSVSHGTTLYVDYDAPGDGRTVRYWLDKHREAFGDGDLSKLVVLEPDVDTYGLAEAELQELTDIAKGTEANLIFIDSFSSAFPSVDPIKLVQVQGPLWYLRRLANETGAAIVVVDHLPKPISGEKAGARGIIGSVAKSAQARAVHILSRVPPKEVEGRNVLRWDTTKMSYGARPEPFGIELRFAKGAVFIDRVALPEGHGETRTERAIRVIQDYLETHRGRVVTHQELLDVAIQEADLRRRASAEAIRVVKDRYGKELITTYLPGRGKPQGYHLKQEPITLIPPASLHQMGKKPLEIANPLLHTPLRNPTQSAPNHGDEPLGDTEKCD